MRILLRRWHALGDTIASTPVAHRLRLENPDAEIDIDTICPTAYAGPGWKNPHINNVGRQGEYDRMINLDMVTESNRRIHFIDAYMEAAFGDRNGPKEIIFPLGPPPDLGVDWDRVIIIHPNNSWQSRRMPVHWWQAISDKLVAAGYTIMVLGTHIDNPPHGSGIIDTRDQLNLWQQARAINAAAAAFLGQSGLFILAAATETPIITPLTISRYELTVPFRRGELGWNCHALKHDLPCYGCNEEYGPVTYVGCLRNDYACIGLLEKQVDLGVELTLKAIAEDKRK